MGSQAQLYLFKTQTTEEAHELLRKRRQRLLAAARDLAYELGRRAGGVTTQEILREMARRGLMDEEDQELDQRWIGALWGSAQMKRDFVVIEYRMQKNTARNCHQAPRRAWKFTGGNGG